MQIEIKNLSKSIHGTQILKNINLTMNGGCIYGLRGRNGSGKTMFMRCLCGLLLPTEGEIIIDGLRIGKEIDFPPSVGVLIENPAFLNGYTGFQNLKMLADIQGKASDEKIKEALQKVGLDTEDKRKYKKYSLGMKQRLGIACAVMESPDLILLDEPLNALDQKGIELVKNLLLDLKSQGKLIVVACHDNQELEYLSDIIYKVDSGRIFLEE